MAVLKFFHDSTIQENNIVQTIASAAGTLSAIIFVLPGLVMIGWWTGFPYWLSVAIIGIGGILGVLYSVPLRRALVTGTDLPYPGRPSPPPKCSRSAPASAAPRRTAAACVMIVVELAGFRRSTPFSPPPAAVTAAAAQAFKVGAGATAAAGSLSMALIGVGHLVGIAVGIAMLVGLLISWVVLVPWLDRTGRRSGRRRRRLVVNDVFRKKVRFIGAGTIGVAAIWTLLRILGADRRRH